MANIDIPQILKRLHLSRTKLEISFKTCEKP